MQGSLLFKPVAILQFILLLFLQFQNIVPAISDTAALGKMAVVCSGDCAQCGCSPARMASGTCCCAKRNRLEEANCCEKRKPVPIDRNYSLHTRPCGIDPISADSFFSCEAYIVPRYYFTPNILSTAIHAELPERLRNMFDEPPVPPH